MKTKRKDPGMGGVLGNVAYVRKVKGRVEVLNGPPKPRALTENQVAARATFLEASQFAKRQTADPKSESHAQYTEGITETKRSAYMVALCDYLVEPTVHAIETDGYRGKVGDTIEVKATDDFMVTRVNVVIKDAAGAVIEEGEAGPDLEQINIWAYKATAANPMLAGTTIKATAYDRPRNKGTAEVTL